MAAKSTQPGAALLGGLMVLTATANTPVGWRTNGNGIYLNTEPPTEWSEDKNVLWKTKLPGRSQGSPILVGERIFVVSDPAELLCLNAATGEVLWQRSSTPDDVLGADKAKEIAAEYARIKNERRTLERERSQAKGDDAKQKEIKSQLESLSAAIKS